MSSARIIWVVWCLAWVLIWAGIGFHDVLAWSDCTQATQQVNEFLGAHGSSCGPAAAPLVWFGLAAASGGVILLPVGRK